MFNIEVKEKDTKVVVCEIQCCYRKYEDAQSRLEWEYMHWSDYDRKYYEMNIIIR